MQKQYFVSAGIVRFLNLRPNAQNQLLTNVNVFLPFRRLQLETAVQENEFSSWKIFKI